MNKRNYKNGYMVSTYKYNNGYLTEIYGQYGISKKCVFALEERQAIKKSLSIIERNLGGRNMKTITMNDYRKIIHAAKKSVENIPYSHCRILQETEERNIVEGIENARERKSGKPLYLALRVLYNQGNRKYPHWIETVELIDIKNVEAHETPCRLYGRKKDNILAFIK